MTAERAIDVLLAAESLLTVRTGVGNYAFNLWSALRELPDIRGVRLFAGLRRVAPEAVLRPPEAPAQWTPPSAGALRHRVRDHAAAQWAFRRLYGARLALLALPPRLAGVPVCYHEPNMIPRPYDGVCVTTFHDLTWHRHPEAMPDERRRWIDRHLARSLAQADRIITDTAFVRDEVAGVLGVDPQRIDVVPLGVSPAYRPRAGEELAPLLARRDLGVRGYLLAVGTVEPRKNLRRLLRAYTRLPQALTGRFPLVVTGASGWDNEGELADLSALERAGRIRYLGYTSADELAALYAGARGFVFPSLYEGFGLPVLEAMASGTPVVCSSSPSLAEVLGGHGHRVDPLDEADIAAGLRAVLEDDAGNRRFVEAGLEHAAGFIWRRCAERTAAVYRRALGLA